MNKRSNDPARIVDIYRKRAADYDASGIAGLGPWRREAVHALSLRRGDLVVDIGCGTGLSFALLREAVGAEGRIVGVDLTDAMLSQARRRIVDHGWRNVELVQCDAAHYTFPAPIDGIISTFALTFIPGPGRVIENGCQALAPGRRWVVLDMAWPAGLPLWLRHGLFFLSKWGITADVIERRPWKAVRETMQQHLADVVCRPSLMGFLYLISGARPGSHGTP